MFDWPFSLIDLQWDTLLLKNEAIGILVAHHPGSGGKDKGAPECDTNEIMTITKNTQTISSGCF